MERSGLQGGVIRLVEPAAGTGGPELPAEPDHTDQGGTADPTGLIDLALGAAGLGLAAIAAILREVESARTGRVAPAARDDDLAGILTTVGFAGLGLAAEAGQQAARFARAGLGALRPLGDAVVEHTPLGRPVRAAGAWLDRWSDLGRAEQRAREGLAARVIEVVVPRVAGAVIERVDLDAAVAQVDLDAAVARVDIGGIVDRIDIAAIVNRIDIDAIVARVDIGEIVDRLDIDAIVAKVDIDAIAARVDVQAIIDRLDLPTLTKTVMDEVDVGEIIRESTGSISTETVDAIRYQGMNADRLVQRIVDRIMFRRDGRELTLPPPADVDVDVGAEADAAPDDATMSPGARE